MDVVYLRPFVVAVQYVFNANLRLDVIVGKPFLRDRDAVSSSISGVIGISGDAIGIIVLRFPKQVADGIVMNMSSDETYVSEPDRETAVSELVNMVVAQAKSEVQDLNISISTPKIVTGRNHQLFKLNSRAVMALPCDCPFGRFTVEMSIITKKPTHC